MKLTIIYDNEIYKNNSGISDHGFSCYIETKQHTVLFDTGTNGKILLKNMNLLSLNPKQIDIVFISHEHYDHNGGFSYLLPYLDNPTVYRLESDDTYPINHEIIVKDPIQITKHIRSTGKLHGSPIDEQSLILDTSNGIVLLTGCSHPGLAKILNTAKIHGNVIGLIGGFHRFSNFNLLQSLKIIYPCHCTKFKKEIKSQFPETAFDCGVGLIIDI